jgi:diaminopropionate ammonia-lyase
MMPSENCELTRLIELPALARRIDVAHVFLKLESDRSLGNFKVLGGMLAAARALARASVDSAARAALPLLICASDGNHGLAVAAAAQRAGTRARVYLPAHVAQVRADRIAAVGGDVYRIAGTYDDAVDAARVAAERGAGILIADTSSDPDEPSVQDVLAGYAQIPRELMQQFQGRLEERPSHLFVQAGVGGLAAAMIQGLHDFMREPRHLVVVEPESVACVAAALAAGHPVSIAGELETAAEMLSCGIASAAALLILQRHHAVALSVSEQALHAAVAELSQAGVPTTASGAAGLAGLLHAAGSPELRATCRLRADSSVLLLVTEGPAER